MSIEEYARNHYRKLLTEPVGQLKYPFLIPGSVYTASLWDWDSWLTDVAISQFAKEDVCEYEKGCILNYLEHINERGMIPVMISPEGFYPTDFLTSESLSNMHKPCLAQHAAFLVKREDGNAEWLRPHFSDLLRFIDCYRRYFRHENGLYFWQDDWAVGVDNDPCVFYRPPKSCGSIFLNCFMVKELEAICYLGKQLGEDMAPYYAEKANLRSCIRKYCYDEKDGMYYSVDFNLLPIRPDQWLHSGAPRHWDCLIQRIGSWSGFLAMWARIATPEQAKRMVTENLLDPKAFWAPNGVRSLSKYEKMYAVKPSGNPSCWLGPVWGISNYLVFRGLLIYGYRDIAKELARKTIAMFERDLQNCGDLHEYYDPESGEPIYNIGFQSWNLLAVNMKAWLNGKDAVWEF